MLKKVIAGITAVILVAMSGCTNNKELYERLIIKAIGIDKTGKEFSVTVRVADYAEDKEYNLVTSGESVFEAMSDLQLAEGRVPMYSHGHFILFGRDVLDNDLRECLDFFIRYYKAHPNIQIFAAAKTASEILQYKNEDGFIPSERMKKLSGTDDITGKSMTASLMELVSSAEAASSFAAIPVLELTQNGATISGTMLLKDYKSADILTDKETAGLLAASGKLKKSVITAESEEFGLLTAEVDSCKTKIDPTENNSVWQIDVKLRLSLASSSAGARSFDDKDFQSMEALFSATMRNYVAASVSAAYSSGCDILGLGQKLYFSDTEYWKETSDIWTSLLPYLSFNINVEAEMERLGEEDHRGK